MTDIFDRCSNFRRDQRIAPAEDLEVAERVLFETLPIANAGPWMQRDGRRVLQFASNDYLGMSVHPEVLAVAADTAGRYGIGAPMGARPLTGTCELHLELERRVAAFKRTEAAVTFSMGAGAMMGVLASLGRPGDLLILDQFAHASLVCGARISGAEIRYFRHNDVEALEKLLRKAEPDRPKLIVVDGVYSMHADLAPLAEICDLRRKYGARVLVDDAHGTGVMGENGRGTAELLGVEDRIDLQAGTFSKAFGTSGGFVAGAGDVIFYVRCLAPTLLFTKAMSACVTAATMKSLEIVTRDGGRRQRLWSNTRHLQERLRAEGFDIGETAAPITPIHLGGTRALHAADVLRREHGIFVSAVTWPAVPRGTAILRAVPTALHTPEDIDRFADALSAATAGLEGKAAATVPPGD